MTTTYAPRQVAGMIRRLPRGAKPCFAVTMSAGKGHAMPVSRAAALRMVRLLYRSGRRVSADVFCDDLIIGV